MVTQLSEKAIQKVFNIFLNRTSIGSVAALYSSISNDLPEDNTSTPPDSSIQIPPGINRDQVSYFTYDEAHSGRFSLFGSNGATIDTSHVLDREDALTFIRDNLSYGTLQSQKECVVFVNGMRTESEPSERNGLMSSERVEFYSDTLCGMKMAHVHCATNMDQPPGKINVNKTIVLKTLTKIMKAANLQPLAPDEDGNILVPQVILDMIQANLSNYGMMETPIKDTLKKLIALATKDSPLTLMVYSRGSMECSAALNEMASKCANKEEKEEFKKKLREALTVVTIATSAKKWLDGPAYIHISTWDDPLARIFCNDKRNTFAGDRAIFLHNNSPYPGTVDTHNFQGGSLQLLAAVMLKNKVRSMRTLWEMGHATTQKNSQGTYSQKLPSSKVGIAVQVAEKSIATAKSLLGVPPSPVGGGNIVIPDNVDALVDAIIAITYGTEYLWEKEESMKKMRANPSIEDSMRLLIEELDWDDEVREIARKFEARNRE